MAKFDTTIGVSYDTDVDPINTREVVQSENPETYFIFDMADSDNGYAGFLRFPFVTSTQKTAIDAFYAANKDIDWEFDHPGDNDDTYTFQFVTKPKFTQLETMTSDKRWFCEFEVIGTK